MRGPSHNLSAQLPFSNYVERCSAHLSREDSNKNTSAGICEKANLGLQVKGGTGGSAERRARQKPIQQNNSKGFCGHKREPCKICNTYQLSSGLITHFTVLKWLKTPSLSGEGAAYVVAIWVTVKHMLASAVGSQDQLSSVTNICLPTTA